jgi:hypothetical protein
MNQKLLVVLCASAALVLLGLNLMNKPESTKTAQGAAQPSLGSNAVSAPIQSQDRTSIKSDATSQNIGLAQQMLTATNLRAFVELAKQHPEKGGVFIAEVAIMDCKQARILTDQKSLNEIIELQVKRYPDRAKHVASAMAAANQLSARCQGFTNADYEQVKLYSGKLGEGRAPDPLVEAMKSEAAAETNGSKRTFEQRRENLELFSKNGLFGHSVGLTALGRHEGSSYVVYFEGKPWGGMQRDSFLAAQTAVNHAAVMKNPQSIYWLTACAYELACDLIDTQEKLINLVLDDRATHGRSKVDKQVLRAEMAQLIPKLQRAVAEGDFRAFSPPPKSAG